MRKSSLWLLVFLALVLQVTLFQKIELWGIRPDSSVIIIVYVSLGLGPIVGCLLGFLIGLAQFSILSAPLPSLPLAGTVIGFIVGRYGTKIMYENYLVQGLIIFVSVLVFDAINFGWVNPSELAGILLRMSIPGALYSGLVGMTLAVFIERIAGLRLVT
jgi:rod shape-determining protein MreD